MADKNRLILAVEGPEQNEHHPDGHAFAEKIKQFLDFLKSSAAESGQNDIAFRLVDLSHDSPAKVVFEPVLKNGTEEDAVIAGFNLHLQSTLSKQYDDVPHQVLSDMAKFAKNIPMKIASTTVGIVANGADRGNEYRFNGHLSQTMEEILRVGEIAETNTVDGILDRINVHGSTRDFTLDTGLPIAKNVKCKFEDGLFDKVQSALSKFVSVHGKCFYRPDAAFPYKVNVANLELLPPSKDLPTLSDLQGIAPGATGGKSPEEFLRKLRGR